MGKSLLGLSSLAVAALGLGSVNQSMGAVTDRAPRPALLAALPGTSPVVGLAATPDGGGYWMAHQDGSIASAGDASSHGPAGPLPLTHPIVGMAATPDGQGYWMVASDGGIFSFGDARFLGSTGAIHLNQPIVGMAATPDGRGYWMVASDGGIFSFGDARFLGSTGAIHLNQPIVGMAATPDGRGYWMVASDGGIFSFGDARFAGAAAGSVPASVVGIAAVGRNGGYAVVTSAALVRSFGAGAGLPPAPPSPVPTAPTVSKPSGLSASAPSTSGPYSFMRLGPGGAPTRYNPCQVLHYVVNLSEAPPGALAVVQAALSEVSAATGIAFAYDGPTTEMTSMERPAYQPSSYGNRWAPILIAWQHPGQTDFLTSGQREAGMGGSEMVLGATPSYITGEAALDADAGLPLVSATGPSWTKVLLHELGHVMGLGHVSDPSQVMDPVISAQTPTTYGSGDRAGLARLGLDAGCLPAPPPQPLS